MERWSAGKWFFGAAFCCAMLAGCNRSPQPATALAQEAGKLNALPGLRGASHPQLAIELQQIEDQRQTPAQLDAAVAGDNSYLPFNAAYPALSRPALQRTVNSLWPANSLRLEPGALQKARELLAQQAAPRERFARALRETSPRPQLRVANALVADDEWLDAIETGCRIEGLAAAEMLAEQEPAAAIVPLEKMLQLCRHLARENHLNARLLAARLRSDAAQVVYAIANHPSIATETLPKLQQLFMTQFSDWPTDDRIFSAERASGLLAYELARAGRFNPLIPRDQLTDLEKKGIARTTETAALRNIDADQLFYLRAMQQQIAVAKLPFWQRQTVIEQLEAELQTRSDSGAYPLIAGSLLLKDVSSIHRTLAEDRARCEAWLILLTTICELPLGVPPACPLTGQPYQVQVDRERAKIAGLELREGETIEVIRPGVIQARRRAAGFDLSSPSLR